MSTSLESFVNVLKRSGLVDETTVDEHVAAYLQTEGPHSGEGLAEFLVARDVITGWQGTKLLQGKHKGFFLGKYKLLRLLGKGGMSSVYLAEHVLMRRRCAIKVLPWKLVKDSSYLQRFHREAQAVASLDHPNIVRAYDIDHEKDGNLEIHFLVMEYVEGRNLYDLVQQSGPLDPEVAADYIRQGALGLEHAHRANMVHRDVKPGNFIVDQNGVVKLMDLGLARISANEEDHSLTIAHDERVLGTADYLAPEQAVDSHLVDTRADIYSLGCTMYFLLAGRPPFNEGTLTQRLLAHQTKEPTPLESLRTDIPPSLLAILRKLMLKDRNERIQTAREVVSELTNWLAEQIHQEHDSTGLRTPPGSFEPASLENQYQDVATDPAMAQDESAAPPSDLGNFLSSLSDVNPTRTPPTATKSARGGSSALRLSRNRQSNAGEEAAREPQPDHFDIPQAESNASISAISTAAPHQSSPHPQAGERTGSSRISKKRNTFQLQDFLKSSLSSLKLSPELTEKLLQNRVPLGIGAGVVLLLVISLIAGLFLWPSGSGNKPTVQSAPEKANSTHSGTTAASASEKTAPPAKRRPEVSGPNVLVGPEGHFGTIQEALNYIQVSNSSGLSSAVHEIQLASGQTFEETISIDNSGLGSFPRNIRIVGQGEKPPRIQPPGKDPAIVLNSVEGLSISNVIINCRGRSAGVRLQGFLSGTRLHQVRFENIEKSGFEGIGLSGFADQPFRLEWCTFQAISPSAKAIVFRSQTSDTRDVAVRQCRLIGPMAAGIDFEDTATSVELLANRFSQAQSGVLFSGQEQRSKRIRFQNNTFHDCQTAIDFESGPASDSTGFVFSRNLFSGTGTTLRAARTDTKVSQMVQGGTLQNNWTDSKEATDGDLDLFASGGKRNQAIEFVSTKPDDGQFLKPRSPNVRLPNASEPFPYVGAMAP